MNDHSSDRQSLAAFLATKINRKEDDIKGWLMEWELTRTKSPQKTTRRSNGLASKKGISNFIYPDDKESTSGRQKIPEDDYQKLSEEVRKRICDRTIKSGGKVFLCAAFPVNENNRCPCCANIKKPKVPTPEVVVETLNTGLNGTKITPNMFSTNFPEIYMSSSYKIENIIFEKSDDSTKAIGFLKDFKCDLEKKGTKIDLPDDWKEKLEDLNDATKKNLARFSNITY